MNEPQPIDIAVWHQRIAQELRAAELQVARLQGQLDLIQEMIQPPKTTEGEEETS